MFLPSNITRSRRVSNNLTALQDWINRSTAAGVTQALRFTTSTDATGYAHEDGTEAQVVFDSGDGIIGDGCLRIDVPNTAGANSGSWRAPLNTAWSDFQGFGATRFYWQFRVKLGPDRLTNSVNGGGFKMMNLAEFRFSSPNSSRSHPQNELVINNQDWRDILFAYRETGAGATGLEIPFGGSDYRLQPAIDRGAGVTPDSARYCLYSNNAGCWFLQEGAWFTVYVIMRIQTYGGTTGNELDIYVARAGETSYTQLFNNRGFEMGADNVLTDGPNGIWFLPYDTGRTSASYSTWQKYDQLIVSTQPIACPLF